MTAPRVRAAVLLGALSTAAVSQSVVIPAGHDLQEGNSVDGMLLQQGEGRRQWIVAETHLDPLRQAGVWSVRELWLRRDMTVGRPASGGSLAVEVWASATATACDGVAGQFAQNRGPGHALRCREQLTFPDLPRSAAAPAPWDVAGGMAVRLRLDPPVSGTGQLCLELVTRPVPGEPVPSFCPDAVTWMPSAAVRFFGGSCPLGRFVPRASAGELALAPGGSTELLLTEVPAGRVALCLHTFAAPGTRAVSLDPGSEPDCTLALAEAPGRAVRTEPVAAPGELGHARLRVPIPLDRALLAGTCFVQWLIPHPGRDPAAAVASHGVTLRLSGSLPSFAVTSVESADPAEGQGRVFRHQVPVLRLVR